MSHLLFFALVTVTFVASTARSLSPGLRMASLASLLAAFSFLYIQATDTIAQDRFNYYLWYRNADVLLESAVSVDRLFSLTLWLLPRGLSEEWFGMIFSTCIFLAAAGASYVLARKTSAYVAMVPLVLVTIVVDRLFIDLALNTSRSTLSSIIFLLAFAHRAPWWRILLFAISYGIHERMFFLLMPTLVLAIFLHRSPKILMLALIVGLASFSSRVIFDLDFLSPAGSFKPIASLSESQSFDRALSLSADLTVSLAAQIALSICIPALLAIKNAHLRDFEGESVLHSLIQLRADRSTIWAFGMVSATVGLLLFPEVLLIQRLFVVPMFTLLFFLRNAELRSLLTLKFLVLFVVLYGQFGSY